MIARSPSNNVVPSRSEWHVALTNAAVRTLCGRRRDVGPGVERSGAHSQRAAARQGTAAERCVLLQPLGGKVRQPPQNRHLHGPHGLYRHNVQRPPPPPPNPRGATAHALVRTAVCNRAQHLQLVTARSGVWRRSYLLEWARESAATRMDQGNRRRRRRTTTTARPPPPSKQNLPAPPGAWEAAGGTAPAADRSSPAAAPRAASRAVGGSRPRRHPASSVRHCALDDVKFAAAEQF